MAFTDNLISITPPLSEIKTGTPILKIGNDYVVGGIGGNFIPAGQGGGSASMDFYKCAAVNSDSTWSGYKATLQEGKIAGYESNAASGLTYTGVLPVVGHIYTEDARLEITSDIPRDAVFYAPLTTSNTTLTGQTLSNNNVYFYSD